MSQSKFSLADVLTLLATLAFGFVCFLGINFYTLGDLKKSIIIAGIIFVLLSITALGAKLLKRTGRNFKTCFIWEIILLVLFTGCMICFSYMPFSHYFVVSQKKTEIQNKLNSSITQAENMFTGYEEYAEGRINLYEQKLKSVVAAKNINPSEYTNYGFEQNNIPDNKQIENKMFTVRADLFPTNYTNTSSNKGIKDVSKKWLADAKNKVEGWNRNPIGIVEVVNKLEENTGKWLSELVNFSSKRAIGEQADDFTYELLFGDVKKDFTTRGIPPLLAICLAVAAYLLMLMSYFITKRHTRYPGLKVVFGSRDSSNNEL